MKRTLLLVLALACLVSCAPDDRMDGISVDRRSGTEVPVQRTKVAYSDAIASLVSTLEAIGLPEYSGKLALAHRPKYVTADQSMSRRSLTKSMQVQVLY